MCLSNTFQSSSHDEGRQLRLLTWNIEGYKTKNLDYGSDNKLNTMYIKHMFENYDIVILTETWTNSTTENKICMQGYHPFHNSRKEKHRHAIRDSGGVAVLVKTELLRFIKREPCLHEGSIWLKLDKTLWGNNRDVYLGAMYLPPEYSSYSTNNILNEWDIIEKEISLFQAKGPVLLCGDFNSRTAADEDYIRNDARDDFINLPHCYIPDNPDILARSYLDATRNNYGKKLIDLCIGRGLLIINGRTQGDLFGNFTCLKYNGCSTVDYNIISKECISYVKSFKVLPLHEFSDHRAISLQLTIPDFDNNRNGQILTDLSDAPGKFVFNEISKNKYRETLLSPEYQNKIRDFKDRLYNESKSEVDNAVNDFTCILKEAARTSAKLVKYRYRKSIKRPWFDTDCFNIRKKMFFTSRNWMTSSQQIEK